MVLGKLPVLLIWIIVGQEPFALAVGAGGCCLDIFSLVYHFFSVSFSLWETARFSFSKRSLLLKEAFAYKGAKLFL